MIDYHAQAELYLGRDWSSAKAQGPRKFKSAAKALRFALEEVAPVSLGGAALIVAGRRFSSAQMRKLYHQVGYPLRRKSAETDRDRVISAC